MGCTASGGCVREPDQRAHRRSSGRSALVPRLPRQLVPAAAARSGLQLIQTLQDGLVATGWAATRAGTIRVALLKVAVRVIERYRVVRVHLPTSYPLQRMWRRLGPGGPSWR